MVGRKLRVNDIPLSIVGVAPPEFHGDFCALMMSLVRSSQAAAPNRGESIPGGKTGHRRIASRSADLLEQGLLAFTY